MKKTVSFIFSFIFLATNVFSDIYLRDSSRYTKFTEKKYITNRNTHICDGEQNIIGAVPSNTRFISFKFAYLKDDTDPALYTFDYLIGYKDGWITTDDIRLENSDILPETIITNNKGKTNKRWIPVWYNSIINSDKIMEEYSSYYKRYKNSEEYGMPDIHHIEFRNTVLTFFDTADKYSFSIQNIRKNNNVYYIKCELDKSRQSYFNEYFEKESLLNLPDLTVNRDAIFIIEPNGNRLRLYNGENYKLIIELMQTNQEWIGLMLKYINSEYKNKPSNLKVIEEKLEHPWSNPVTGLYATSVRSGEAAAFSNAALKKTMSVKENLKLRSGEATTTSVLAVMSAGTRVKILRLGKQATIDGITSNWVQVEVQAGAKDRDGKAIAAGTTGWCFGGYLAER